MVTDKNFRDWHADVLGYGYGSGEEHWIPTLTRLLSELVHADGGYNYEELESAFGGLGAWLLINALCGANVFDYGSSPRFGWLSPVGQLLREYVSAHSAEELIGIVDADETVELAYCYRDYCNCVGTSGVTCNPLFGLTA